MPATYIFCPSCDKEQIDNVVLGFEEEVLKEVRKILNVKDSGVATVLLISARIFGMCV